MDRPGDGADGGSGAMTRRRVTNEGNRFMDTPPNSMTAILPCNDLDASEAFYKRLGFKQLQPDADYRILCDGKGAHLHLCQAVEGWLIPGRNPFGLYLATEHVDQLAAQFIGETIEPNGPEHKPWGTYEFSLSDPDETLVRVGWPSRLMSPDSD
jgi:catechol 2,3-dioxygenase-like lactoylglutathione lyase family enzyme